MKKPKLVNAKKRCSVTVPKVNCSAVRKIEEQIKEIKPQLRGNGASENPVHLSFIAHSMGAFVVTNALRILSDAFKSNSTNSNSDKSNVGEVFCLRRLVLVAPDIPAEALISNRSNYLSEALLHFPECYLFSNQGDEVLRQISRIGNYFSFPARHKIFGYRLGNLGIVSDKYKISREGVNLKYLKVGHKTLEALYRKLHGSVFNDALPKKFSYFDCTDCVNGNGLGVLTYAKKIPEKKPHNLKGKSPRNFEKELNRFTHLKLLLHFFLHPEHLPNGHAGYFYSAFLRPLIYRLVCIGYHETEQAYGGEAGLNTECEKFQIKVLLNS